MFYVMTTVSNKGKVHSFEIDETEYQNKVKEFGGEHISTESRDIYLDHFTSRKGMLEFIEESKYA